MQIGVVEEHSICEPVTGVLRDEGALRGVLERIEKKMLVLVTIMRLEKLHTENLRFPEQR